MRKFVSPAAALLATVAVVLVGAESASASEAGRYIAGRFGRY